MPDYEKIAEGVELPRPAPEEGVEIAPEKQREFFPLDHPKYQGLAAAKGYDQTNERLQRVHYSHEAMIDEIIANPNIKQNDLAKKFDRTVHWISRIMGSDAFQAALAKRREEITDPFLVATVEERFKGLAFQSLDIIAEKLETTRNADLALKALDISGKALGYGARGPSTQQNNQFVIQLPSKSQSADEWIEQTAMKRLGNG